MDAELRQYIIEQEHRQDVVGELGRWVLNHPKLEPDAASLGFRLAMREFESVNHRTRKRSIAYMEQHAEFQRILQIEPKMKELVQRVINTKVRKGYSFSIAYTQFKKEFSQLVGYRAERVELRTAEAYDVTMDVISFLLPVELSSDGYSMEINHYNLDV